MRNSQAALATQLLMATGRPDRTTDRVRQCVEWAVVAAGDFGSQTLDSTHLLYGLVREANTVAFHILEGFGVKRETLERIFLESSSTVDVHPTIDSEVVATLASCWTIASALKHNYIGTEHVLLAMVESPSRAARLLQSMAVDTNDISVRTRALLGGSQLP